MPSTCPEHPHPSTHDTMAHPNPLAELAGAEKKMTDYARIVSEWEHLVAYHEAVQAGTKGKGGKPIGLAEFLTRYGIHGSGKERTAEGYRLYIRHVQKNSPIIKHANPLEMAQKELATYLAKQAKQADTGAAVLRVKPGSGGEAGRGGEVMEPEGEGGGEGKPKRSRITKAKLMEKLEEQNRQLAKALALLKDITSAAPAGKPPSSAEYKEWLATAQTAKRDAKAWLEEGAPAPAPEPDAELAEELEAGGFRREDEDEEDGSAGAPAGEEDDEEEDDE